MSAGTPGSARDGGAVALINHVVVPVATIAMVSALLFFLLDVRSAFLTGTEALKWVGFWFVTASVLIARYGRASANVERQGCYTLALAAATLVAMTVSPWARPSGGLANPLINLVIVAAVWRFATRLTRALSLEGGLGKAPEPRLYGVERLRMEAWRREHPRELAAAPSAGRRPEASTSLAGGNPGAPVARLAATGIVIFALAEPLLLSAPPAVGERALGAMIAFLLAAGVVLAAGSGLGTLRRVRAAGGRASLGGLPGRVALAGLTMVALLALALAVPGIEYRGTGVLRPGSGQEAEQRAETARQGGGGEASGGEESAGEADRGRGSEPEAPSPETSDRGSSGDGRRGSRSSGSFSAAASSLVGQLAELGRWLRYLVAAGVGLLALWGLWRLLKHLSSARRWLRNGIGRLWRQLLAAASVLFRRRRRRRQAAAADPFADWQALSRLEPRHAVLDAYGRLLAAFELLGHPRPERHTPYEFLASIPPNLKTYAGPARRLTDLYVKAAYSRSAADGADRKKAVAALEEIKMSLGERS